MSEVAGRYTPGNTDPTAGSPPFDERVPEGSETTATNGILPHPSSVELLESLSSDVAPTVVIKPDQGWLDLDLRQVWNYRELLLALASRDIKLRYRQTALGAIWVVLQPMISAGVFTLIFNGIARLESGGVPPFLFYYAALLGWNAFSTTLNRASGCIVGNSGLIAKIYFPRLVLPLSVIFSSLLDFCVAFTVMLVLMAFFGLWPTTAILLLPLLLLMLLLSAMGFGLIASALMVTYRDVSHILPVVTSLLMYASAVVFSLSEALRRTPEEWHFLFYVNPLTGLIEGFRWSLLGAGQLSVWSLVYAAVFSVAIFICGMVAFHRKERWFADAI